MFQSKKHNLVAAGDYVTEEESQFNREDDIERRCETITEVVKNKVFPLERALSVYNVSFRQYFGYLMLQSQTKIHIDSNIFASFISVMLDMIDISDSHRNTKAEKIVADLRQLSMVK